ncbi:MAG: hypothetical protein AAFX03_14125, partial [Pseudomonadota bacterium]
AAAYGWLAYALTALLWGVGDGAESELGEAASTTAARAEAAPNALLPVGASKPAQAFSSSNAASAA